MAEMPSDALATNGQTPGLDAEDPCRHCEMSNWYCLDLLNRAYGRHCCGMCGFTDGHGVIERIGAVTR